MEKKVLNYNDFKIFLDNKFKNDFLKGKRVHEAFQEFTEKLDSLDFSEEFKKNKKDFLKKYYDDKIIELNSENKDFLGTIVTNRILIKNIVKYSKEIFDIENDEKFIIADFFVGTGGFIKELYQTNKKNSYWGYEINNEMFKILNKNLSLNSIKLNFNNENFFKNYKESKQVDFIISNPPFNLKENNLDNLKKERKENFIEILLGKLNNNGFASLIISEGDFKSIQKFKKNDFYKKYNLKAIWKLPQKTFAPQVTVGAYVIFLEKKSQESDIITYSFDIKGKTLEENDFKDFDKLISNNIDESDNIGQIKFKDLKKDDKGIIFKTSNNFSEIDINKLINQIHSSNKIITTNFSKLLGNLSISWTPETQTKITDIIKSIQESQKIQSAKLYEILTALTVSNFLILSGPSGVGKTSLVEKISNAIGGNFKKSPIKSNFTDESGLLGYYNPLLSRYEGTEVLEFIFKSSKDTQTPYFLLLDEMNLSRIENYFSDFLARIDEIKSGTGAEIKLFDVLVDNESKFKNIKYFIEKYNLDEKEVSIINGDFEDLQKEYKPNEKIDLQIEVKIKLYSNLHIVGTINEDETTNSISNKVLDRAFYISLGVDDLFEENKEENEKFLSIVKEDSTFKKNDKVRFDEIEFEEFWKNEIIKGENFGDFINQINKLIQEINKNDAIGYRAIEDIATFIRNYKENINNFDEKKTLDLVLCQKVWPKIKNYSIIGEKETKFEELKKKVGEYLGNESESYKFLDSINLF